MAWLARDRARTRRVGRLRPLLLRQAAALLLGLPAADCAAEREMHAQALGEDAADAEDTAQGVEDVRNKQPEDVWAAAVQQFQQNTRYPALPPSYQKSPHSDTNSLDRSPPSQVAGRHFPCPFASAPTASRC